MSILPLQLKWIWGSVWNYIMRQTSKFWSGIVTSWMDTHSNVLTETTLVHKLLLEDRSN